MVRSERAFNPRVGLQEGLPPTTLAGESWAQVNSQKD